MHRHAVKHLIFVYLPSLSLCFDKSFSLKDLINCKKETILTFW